MAVSAIALVPVPSPQALADPGRSVHLHQLRRSIYHDFSTIVPGAVVGLYWVKCRREDAARAPAFFRQTGGAVGARGNSTGEQP